VATDPFFADHFEWKGHVERYLTRPAIRPEDISSCSAVFVSHIHGDHFDPEAIEAIVGTTAAEVWAPPDVADVLRGRGSCGRVVALDGGAELRAGRITARACAGYDHSYDDLGRPNKFSLLLEADGTRLFYSGDCHEPPPDAVGDAVDAVVAWPHPDDTKLRRLVGAFRTKRLVLMHGDRFEPGDFFCNFDYDEQKRRVERLMPGMEALIPRRLARAGG